jgi:hypothetical protein
MRLFRHVLSGGWQPFANSIVVSILCRRSDI